MIKVGNLISLHIQICPYLCKVPSPHDVRRCQLSLTCLGSIAANCLRRRLWTVVGILFRFEHQAQMTFMQFSSSNLDKLWLMLCWMQFLLILKAFELLSLDGSVCRNIPIITTVLYFILKWISPPFVTTPTEIKLTLAGFYLIWLQYIDMNSQ